MSPAYDQIPAMREAGLCLKQIAYVLGVSESAVSHHARRFNVSFNTKRAGAILAAPVDGPSTSRALAARMGVKPNAVRASMSQLQREGRVEKCGHERIGTRWVAVWRLRRAR